MEVVWLMLQQQRPDEIDYRDYVSVDPRFYRKETGILVANPCLAQARLGWVPMVGFEELVKEMVEHDLVAAEKG